LKRRRRTEQKHSISLTYNEQEGVSYLQTKKLYQKYLIKMRRPSSIGVSPKKGDYTRAPFHKVDTKTPRLI
jgi:hypothetical protein